MQSNFKMSVVEDLTTVTVMIRGKVTLAITAMVIIQLMIPKPMKILVATPAAVIPIPVVMPEAIPITTQLLLQQQEPLQLQARLKLHSQSSR